MDDEVRLRDVDERDLETFYEYEHDREAVERSMANLPRVEV